MTLQELEVYADLCEIEDRPFDIVFDMTEAGFEDPKCHHGQGWLDLYLIEGTGAGDFRYHGDQLGNGQGYGDGYSDGSGSGMSGDAALMLRLRR